MSIKACEAFHSTQQTEVVTMPCLLPGHEPLLILVVVVERQELIEIISFVSKHAG